MVEDFWKCNTNTRPCRLRQSCEYSSCIVSNLVGRSSAPSYSHKGGCNEVVYGAEEVEGDLVGYIVGAGGDQIVNPFNALSAMPYEGTFGDFSIRQARNVGRPQDHADRYGYNKGVECNAKWKAHHHRGGSYIRKFRGGW